MMEGFLKKKKNSSCFCFEFNIPQISHKFRVMFLLISDVKYLACYGWIYLDLLCSPFCLVNPFCQDSCTSVTTSPWITSICFLFMFIFPCFRNLGVWLSKPSQEHAGQMHRERPQRRQQRRGVPARGGGVSSLRRGGDHFGPAETWGRLPQLSGEGRGEMGEIGEMGEMAWGHGSYDFHGFSQCFKGWTSLSSSNFSWKSEDVEGEESLNDVKTCQIVIYEYKT